MSNDMYTFGSRCSISFSHLIQIQCIAFPVCENNAVQFSEEIATTGCFCNKLLNSTRRSSSRVEWELISQLSVLLLTF